MRPIPKLSSAAVAAVALPVLLALAGCPGGAATADEDATPTTTAGAAAGDPPAKEPHVNRLAKEQSPYLLQHQHNPVDWFPWGDEAFAKAKEEDKPIFLSVGYSTCHWCHVMERESFENEVIAAYLNEHFVSIKVDREERPDVDAVYMAVTQAMTGRGGWPMSVFMTPERKPFFAGTYFPPDDSHGRAGFLTLLNRIQEAWTTKRDAIERSSGEITDLVNKEGRRGAGGSAVLDLKTIARGVESYAETFDSVHGGFGRAPKFPRTHDLSFLMRWAERVGDVDTLGMVTTTLDHMERGGIYDHLGGGFHRYATDREWLVPHFEKMLYDQALISRTYLEAYQATGIERYAAVTRDIFRYVLRDLQDGGGGLYSAEDADSEGVEGKFYLWTHAQLIEALGEEDGALFCRVYGVTKVGNYHEEATGEATGENILHLPRPFADLARTEGMSPEVLEAKLAPLRDKLFDVREPRIHPFKDDKILTDWNGLMIASLALGARVLDEPAYADAARGAAAFCLERMRTDDGRLLHRYRAGSAGIAASQEDYAYLTWGLLELYTTTLEPRWLAAAKELAHAMIEHFWDPEAGGFFLTANDAEALIARTKELYDGARPSGNSVAIVALTRLGRLLDDEALRKKGDEALKAFSGQISAAPRAYSFAMQAVDFVVGPSREVVIAGDPADAATQALLAEVRKRFLPNVVVVLHPPGEAGAAIRGLVPYVKDQGLVDGKPAAYVCTDYTCQAPVTDPAGLGKLLDAR